MPDQPSTSVTTTSEPWIVYALIGLVVGGYAAWRAVAANTGLSYAVFVGLCAYSATLTTIRHFRDASRRAKSARAGAHRGGDR